MFSRFFFGILFLFGTSFANNLTQTEIKHVVVLMLENRSFDNVLGWLYSEDAPLQFIPSDQALPFQGLSPDILSKYNNVLQDASGKIIYSSTPIFGIPSTIGSRFINSPKENPNEPFDHVMKQIYGSGSEPTMLGFLQDYASLWDESDWIKCKQDICAVMETYTTKELPVLQSLARHYAVSDCWFSSVPTQTNPNRAFLVCGTSEGQVVNGQLGRSVFNSDTIWNRLCELSPDTSWTIFWQSDTLPGVFPGPYDAPFQFAAMKKIPNLNSHYQKLDIFHELARKGELPDFSFIEPQWTFSEGLELYDLKILFPDSGYLLGLQGNDLHPPGDVRTAENLLANIYTSLIANPDAWEKTLFIILFDEHGGIFDHISPPVAIPPDSHFENGFKFDRYGVRTPALFISPRIKQGTVIRSDSDTPFDHTSMAATLFKWKNIPNSKWNMGKRVDKAPTFEAVITENLPRTDAVLGSVNASAKTLSMGDPILLKNPQGKYLSISHFDSYATVGNAGATLQLYPTGGKVTHGSFVLIKCKESLLDSGSLIGDCYFTSNDHRSSQWWTIKSVDHPYLGYEIQDGDKVYIEGHIYLKPQTFLPARLATANSVFLGKSVTTVEVSSHDADAYYWTIEKAAAE